MGTPMAVNYANLFLEKFETEMLNEYEWKTKLRPYVWMRYIDDIFFIWHHDEKSLQEFLKFCVNVRLTGNSISTLLYTKETNAHLYLNAKSSQPRHVIKNLPKGQFIRIRRICSEDSEFDRHAQQTKKYFAQRGFTENICKKQ